MSAPRAYAQEASSTPEIASTTPEVTAPLPDPVAIVLDVETPTGTLFNGQLSVSACPISPTDTTSTVSGYCALEQAGLMPSWSWYGTDAFLDTLGGVGNDDTNNIYWAWFSDLSLGATALNKHELRSDEALLVTLGVMPMRITANTLSPTAGATTTVHITHFAYDENYNALWLPAASSTLHMGEVTVTPNENGDAIFAAPTSTMEIYATEDGYLPSGRLTLTPTPIPQAPQESPAPTGGASSGGGGGPTPQPQQPSVDTVARAAAFLISRLHEGHLSSDLLTDWAALALAQHQDDPAVQQLIAYEKQLAPQTLTDVERHALALEALSVNPYDGGFIAAIAKSFDGTQFGDADLVNDDIFALIPLTHAGYDAGDAVTTTDVAYILSKQNADGSWEGVDLTAAAVQALTPLSNIDGVSAALARAKNYLDTQAAKGNCFGNVYSAIWAAMAQIALGETPSTCLANMQQADGGFGSTGDTLDNRLWATAYALPALENQSWVSLLKQFPKPTETTPHIGGLSITAQPAATSTASTTPMLLNIPIELDGVEIVMGPAATSTATSTIHAASTTHVLRPIKKSAQTKISIAHSVPALTQPAAATLAEPTVGTSIKNFFVRLAHQTLGWLGL